MERVQLPLLPEIIHNLYAGQSVVLEGELYVARDAAHARLVQLIQEQKPLPFDLRGTVIYYMGPTPTPPGAIIGSCGPTTASRMDPFTTTLLAHGLSGMIGKGQRSSTVLDAIVRYHAVYFYAFGGCGALYASRVEHNEMVAFEDLGPEAIYKLIVRDFPVIVANDCHGESVFFEPTE